MNEILVIINAFVWGALVGIVAERLVHSRKYRAALRKITDDWAACSYKSRITGARYCNFCLGYLHHHADNCAIGQAKKALSHHA
jgi:hypothetical protein